MKPLLFAASFALCAAAAPRAGEPAAPPITLRFSPAPGSESAKSFRIEHFLRQDSMGMTRDGGPFEPDLTTATIESWLSVKATDRYLALDSQRPTHLVRSFSELAGRGRLRLRPQGTGQQVEVDATLFSPLRRKSIDFLWIPEEQDWSRCYSSEHLEEAWLAHLDGDLDFLWALPAGEVAEGDTWDIPIDQVRRLLAPGGNQVFTPSTSNTFSRTIEVGVGGDLSEVLGPDLVVRLTARFAGVREVDGASMGVIQLSLEGLHSLSDRTELYRRAMPEEERSERMRLAGVLLEYRLDATGELLWDLAAGHAHSLDLKGQETYVTNMTKELPEGETVSRIDATATFSGTITATFGLETP